MLINFICFKIAYSHELTANDDSFSDMCAIYKWRIDAFGMGMGPRYMHAYEMENVVIIESGRQTNRDRMRLQFAVVKLNIVRN